MEQQGGRFFGALSKNENKKEDTNGCLSDQFFGIFFAPPHLVSGQQPEER